MHRAPSGIFMTLALIAACGGSPEPPAKGANDAQSGGTPTPSGGAVYSYKDEAGAFSVVFPMPFVIDVRHDAAGSSELVTTTASATTSNERVNYVVVKTVMQPALQYDCERALTTMRDKTLQKFSCKPTSETPITGAKWPGREVAFACTMAGLKGLLALYCDDSQVSTEKRASMYEVFTAAAQQLYSESDARAFLSSFQPSR